MTLKTPLCDLLNVEHPILLAGMGGVAYAPLCAAVSEAGGYGSLGMAFLPPETIRDQMRQVREVTDRPFGVDLLAALPDTLDESVEIIVEGGASAFIAGLGTPSNIIRRLHEGGLLVMQMCGEVEHAMRAEQAGVDIVIAQGTEAGGHTGKIGAMALIPQIVDAVKIPVVAAGGIIDGRGLAAALSLGTQGIWMGTRFVASREAHAGDVYKEAVLEARAKDTTVTRAYSGKTMRVLKNPYVEEWEMRPQDIRKFPAQFHYSEQTGVMGITGGVMDLNPAKDCMPMGQGAGAVHEILTCREIIQRTMEQAETIIAGLGGSG